MKKINLDDFKNNQPWERQPWDTEKSYLYFRKYYLEVPPDERGMRDSYTRYRADKGLPPDPGGQVPGSWVYWFNGKNHEGLQPKGSVYALSRTWAQRANAYDDHQRAWQEQIDRELWIKRRRKIRDEEWAIGERLQQRGLEMLKSMVFDKVVDTATGLLMLKANNWTEKDIGATFDLALKLQRRAAEMDQGKLAIEFDWKKQLEENGIDAGDLFNKLVGEIAANLVVDADTDGEGPAV